MIVRMWEATVQPGQLEAALGWVRRSLVPRVLETPGCMAAEILRNEGVPARVMLMTRWDTPPRFEEGWPEGDVLTRARAWQYQTL